jgi:hypothetical protein
MGKPEEEMYPLDGKAHFKIDRHQQGEYIANVAAQVPYDEKYNEYIQQQVKVHASKYYNEEPRWVQCKWTEASRPTTQHQLMGRESN